MDSFLQRLLEMSQNSNRYPWGLPTVLGLLLIVLGGFAIAVPFIATLEISWLMGTLFIISGVTQLFHTFQFDPMRSRVGRLLLAALSVVAGVLVLRNPITGAFAITLVMAFYFLAASVGRAALAFELGRGTGKGWLAFSSVISLFLGIYLLSTLLVSSLTIPVIFLGVDLIFYGVALITLGVGAKHYGLSAEPSWPSKVA